MLFTRELLEDFLYARAYVDLPFWLKSALRELLSTRSVFDYYPLSTRCYTFITRIGLRYSWREMLREGDWRLGRFENVKV